VSTVGEPSSSDRIKFEFQPWLSPDEKEVAFDLIDAQTKTSDLWLVDLARNVSSRFTFDSGDEGKPVWSPDGTTIAFDRRASSLVPLELYLKPVGRSGKERSLYAVKGSTLVPTDWSRDGRFLMFLLNDSKTKNDLWVLPDPLASGDPKPVPFAQSEFNENDGAFSPDSKWVAYNSDESGSNQVYVQPFPPSGGKWQISKNGGKFPKWRRDGKEMFFVGADNKMMAVDIKLGDSVEAGIPKALFQTTIPNRSRYAVTGDGQRFLAPDLTGDSENSQALPVVMLNWAGASHGRARKRRWPDAMARYRCCGIMAGGGTNRVNRVGMHFLVPLVSCSLALPATIADRSDFVVAGQVAFGKQTGSDASVTIRVDRVLKGNADTGALLTVHTRSVGAGLVQEHCPDITALGSCRLRALREYWISSRHSTVAPCYPSAYCVARRPSSGWLRARSKPPWSRRASRRPRWLRECTPAAQDSTGFSVPTMSRGL
jgi:WD40-like Beta Propeller Repeat